MAKKSSLAKKVFIAVCATLISSFILGSLSSLLKKDDEDHKHKWGSGEVILPATCASDGEILYECSCGKTKIEVIPAGHVDVGGDFLCDMCFVSLVESSGNIDGVGTYYIFIPEYYRNSSFDLISGNCYFGSLQYNSVESGDAWNSLNSSRYQNLDKVLQFSLDKDFIKLVISDGEIFDSEYNETLVNVADNLYIDFMIIEGYQVYKVT